MNPRFHQLPPDQQAWIQDYVNGTLDEAGFAAFQNELARNPALRSQLRRYLALDDHLRRGSDEAAGISADWQAAAAPPPPPKPVAFSMSRLRQAWPAALAACLAFGLAVTLFWKPRPDDTATEEAVASGFAVVTRLLNAQWPEGASARREGDALGSETFALADGAAEIQFFCGATVTLQGPARLTLDSAWAATCHAGSLRVHVPPAARGFKLHAPDTEITDLGTELGLEVTEAGAKVAVFEGEIAMRHREGPEQIVPGGKGFDLPKSSQAAETKVSPDTFPNPALLDPHFQNQRQRSFERWQTHRDTFAADPRLIAYYTFDQPRGSGSVANLAVPNDPESAGAIILAETVDGRWPGLKQALEFRRPGSRVRVNLPGEFQAFTFSAWVRIDSLDRRYSSLFMADGYETGEPHWQLRDDGKLMLSVMVDDTRPNPKMPEDAGFHRVYYSPPVWDVSKSGQWMHLTSVFDPAAREVRHYVDGRRVSEQAIEPDFFIGTLRIGNAEIGNWGEPFRDTPWFAIRHLNGRIDELAVFKAALTDEAIARIFEGSRTGSAPARKLR
ncbi:MAG: FecR domain-containing protein [Verrucomicrobiales bacterium]|nr:FecR domain-containing protein [Verrucomicrobiales bacterium]